MEQISPKVEFQMDIAVPKKKTKQKLISIKLHTNCKNNYKILIQNVS